MQSRNIIFVTNQPIDDCQNFSFFKMSTSVQVTMVVAVQMQHVQTQMEVSVANVTSDSQETESIALVCFFTFITSIPGY
jgi:hypothetical protein